MKLKIGNLFDSHDPVILVTGNSYITKDGRLVMGRGAALQLKNMIPGIDKDFGRLITRKYGHLGFYGVVMNTMMGRYGMFQVKYRFDMSAELELIKQSVGVLLEKYSDAYVSMNFPGIGYGNLKFDDVFPYVNVLDDNVTIYLDSIKHFKKDEE